MNYALLFLFGVAFLELVLVLDLRKEVVRIYDRSREAMRVLTSEASDDEKEIAMRRESLALFKATGMFVAKFLLVAAALGALYLLVVATFPGRRDAILASLVSPVDIALLTAATLLYGWARNAAVKKL